MAPFANRKIVTAKRPFAVVAARAARTARRSVVVQRERRGHLSSLAETGSDLVTFDARQLLRRIMTRMTKPDAIRRDLFRSANETAELVTRRARRNVAPVRLRVRGVTAKTRRVRVQPSRNRQRDTATAASMTGHTSRAGMFRMIEPDVETLQRRKRFHLSTLSVRVADGTDLARLVRELLLMTTRARRVRVLAGQRGLRCVVLATMTKQTWQSRMVRVVVLEL